VIGDGSLLRQLVGSEADALLWWQVVVRAVVIYVAALAMVRLGDKRFLGKNTAFDVIIGVMLGSVVSRSITGTADLATGIAGGFTLVALHWAFAWVAFRCGWFGTLVKGSSRTLVDDGRIQWDAMRRSAISHDDLLSALRKEGGVDSLDRVRSARLERSGSVSVLTKQAPPRIVSVRVADGVQHITIELGA
jgi:uncharacterized membrane protein YcaP (DUF421 family)